MTKKLYALTFIIFALICSALQSPTPSFALISFEGDFNGDGLIDASDINLLTERMRIAKSGGAVSALYDIDGDGAVDEGDLDILIHDILHTYYGDANLDGEFNSSDFVYVFQVNQFTDRIPGNSGWETGDWNGDGDFNNLDIVIAFIDGGYESGPRP